jgi:hypothetical protein
MLPHLIKAGEKILYGFGFGTGMGLSFKLLPIDKDSPKHKTKYIYPQDKQVIN